jgi:hypothetical protein
MNQDPAIMLEGGQMKRYDARWREKTTRLLVLAASLSALLSAGTARAEEARSDRTRPPALAERAAAARSAARQEMLTAGTFRFNGRFSYFNPANPPPGGPGNTSAPFLPPGVQETYPLAPFTQPDVLRNYLQMRATSPRPNEFMGGQFNPQYRSVAPPRDRRHHYGYYGSGYVDPYLGGYGYGGYVLGPSVGTSVFPSIYSGYGAWYPQYLPQERVVVQREVIYMRPPEPPSESRTEPQTRPEREPAAGEYYLSRPRQETLNDAIEDIRRAWLNGDYARFRSRVKEDGRVRIYLKGKYQYSVGSPDFGQMTRDAMARIDTTGFELDRVAKQGEERAFVSGKHTYMDPDKSKREVYVSYGLEREDGQWRITQAGSSSTAIEKHDE